MKNIFHSRISVLVILFSTIAFSCSEEFLDVPVQGGVTAETDPALAAKLVTGVYNSLLQGDSWGRGDVHGLAFISVTSIMSDNAEKGSTPSDQAVPIGDINDFTLTSTNAFAESLWKGHYYSIGTANKALRELETAAIDEDTKNQFQGEVRFLRGYIYFNLVRMFGAVPLVIRVPDDAEDANTDPAFRNRAPVAEVYESIEDDLRFAADHLPLKSQTVAGHATKGAAQAMLAKVHMYQEEWEEVFELTDEVISSNQYALVDDYATIWRQEGQNSSESIFEIQTGEFNNANFKIDNYVVSQGPRVGGSGGWNDLGWGLNTPSTNLVNAYEPGDKRREATIIFIDDSGDHEGTVLWDGFRIPSADSVQNLYYNYKAYTSQEMEEYANPLDKDRPKNVRILRYADVLLMNAEAAIHTGLGDPATHINSLRERAGLDPVGSVTVEDVWHERRVELAMEHDRFWDIVRQGRATEVMHAAGKTNFTAGVHELLPIPNSQILLSGGSLEQNNGY